MLSPRSSKLRIYIESNSKHDKQDDEMNIYKVASECRKFRDDLFFHKYQGKSVSIFTTK